MFCMVPNLVVVRAECSLGVEEIWRADSGAPSVAADVPGETLGFTRSPVDPCQESSAGAPSDPGATGPMAALLLAIRECKARARQTPMRCLSLVVGPSIATDSSAVLTDSPTEGAYPACFGPSELPGRRGSNIEEGTLDSAFLHELSGAVDTLPCPLIGCASGALGSLSTGLLVLADCAAVTSMTSFTRPTGHAVFGADLAQELGLVSLVIRDVTALQPACSQLREHILGATPEGLCRERHRREPRWEALRGQGSGPFPSASPAPWPSKPTTFLLKHIRRGIGLDHLVAAFKSLSLAGSYDLLAVLVDGSGGFRRPYGVVNFRRPEYGEALAGAVAKGQQWRSWHHSALRDSRILPAGVQGFAESCELLGTAAAKPNMVCTMLYHL